MVPRQNFALCREKIARKPNAFRRASLSIRFLNASLCGDAGAYAPPENAREAPPALRKAANFSCFLHLFVLQYSSIFAQQTSCGTAIKRMIQAGIFLIGKRRREH
jgi:hypothetical protein